MDGDPLEWLARHETALLAGLNEWLAIPSVSARTEHREDVARCAEWLATDLRRIGAAENAPPATTDKRTRSEGWGAEASALSD